MIKHPAIFLLLFLLPLPAQETPKHTCRILFLQGPDSAPDKLHLFDGATSREVELPRLNLSPVYELRPGDLTLTMLPAAPAKPDEIPAGAPTAKVAATVADFYLLVTSDPENKIAPVRIQVVPIPAERLRLGQMLWFNQTENAIGGTVGSETLRLMPKSSVILGAPVAGLEDYPVNLSFTIAGKDHIYPLCETRWRHDPRSRHLAFVLAGAGTRTPRVFVFPDYREASP